MLLGPSHSRPTTVSSPYLQLRTGTKLSPLLNFARNSPQLKPAKFAEKKASTFKKANDRLPQIEKKSSSNIIQEEEKKKDQKPNMIQSSKRVPWLDTTNAKDIVLSPSIKQVTVHKETPSSPLLNPQAHTYCTCGQQCLHGKKQCSNCVQKNKSCVQTGFLYQYDEEDPEKLIRYWYSLMGKELYRN